MGLGRPASARLWVPNDCQFSFPCMKSDHHPRPACVRLFLASILLLPGIAPGAQPPPGGPPRKADEVVQLSSFEVSSDRDRGYASTHAIGGTRFNTELINIPQSVIVLNQEFMRDVGANSVLDAAVYVSGVSSTAGSNREVFNVRGYQIGVTTDGFPDASPTAQGLSTPFELLDRVEIIKGPAAVLYGSTSPGGNVNRVTKKPLFRRETTLQAAVGEGGFRQGMFDVNHAAPAGTGKVAMRVIGSYERFDDVYVNFSDSTAYFLSPQFAWRLGERTTITVQPYYLERNYHKLFGNLFQFRPFDRTGPLSFQFPRDMDWGGDYAREKFDIRRLYATVEHRVAKDWVVRLAGVGKTHDEYNNDVIARDLLPDNRRMQRTWRIARTRGEYRVFSVDSLVNYSVGKTKHKTLALAQYDRQRIAANIETGRKLSGQVPGENADATFSNLPLVDVLSPTPAVLNARPDTTFISSRTYSQGEVRAFSLQHQMEMMDGRVVLNGGLRHDHTKPYAENRLTNRVTSTGRTDSHVTKRIGGVYKPVTGLAVFYNHSETFAPQFSVNPDGTGFKPTEGVTDELGLKSDLLNGRLSGTVSFFTIDNKNLIVIDPDPLRASAGFRSQSAKDSLDGFEVDAHFNVVPGLQLVAAYSRIKSKTNNGLRVRNVPEDTFALFASFQFGEKIPQWSAGGGVRYKGDNPGDAGNVFFLASATVADAFVNYRHSKALLLRLNGTNIFDKYYADSSINRNLINVGAPRRIRLTATYTF